MSERKIQSTYRAGAKTPDIIKDSVDKGTKAAGSFSKFVDNLVLENIELGGKLGDIDIDVNKYVAEAASASAPAASEAVTIDVEQIKNDIVNAANEAYTEVIKEQTDKLSEKIQTIQMSENESGIGEAEQISLPTTMVTKDDLRALLREIMTLTSSNTEEIVKVITERFDSIEEQLKDICDILNSKTTMIVSSDQQTEAEDFMDTFTNFMNTDDDDSVGLIDEPDVVEQPAVQENQIEKVDIYSIMNLVDDIEYGDNKDSEYFEAALADKRVMKGYDLLFND